MSLKLSADPFPSDPLTVCQAAELVRVSRMTISRRMGQGHLRHWRDRVSGRVRLSRADVLALYECRAPMNYRRRVNTSATERQKAATVERVRKMFGLPT